MEDKSTKKILVEREIFRRQSEKPFAWKNLKHIQFEDDDILHIGYDEGYYSENNSWDPHYYAIVTRMIEETDEEFDKRQKRIEQDAKWARERRYENFLKLKEEFEPKNQ